MLRQICQNCGAELAEKARFCTKCGSRTGQVCQACGAELPAAALFCNKCGKKAGIRVCQACGSDLPEGVRFCIKCGHDSSSVLQPKKSVPVISPKKRPKMRWQYRLAIVIPAIIFLCVSIPILMQRQGQNWLVFTARPEDYYNQGLSLEKQEDYDGAIAQYSKAIKVAPDYIEPYVGRGRAYQKQQQYDLAIIEFDKAIQLDQECAEAYHNRGSCYAQKEQYDLAIGDYNNAIELDSDNAYIYFDRAFAYEIKDVKDLAVADYTQAIMVSEDAELIELAREHLADLVTYPPAIPGDPPFTSASSEPSQERIGPFKTQPGDYFVSYTMTDAEFAAYQADYDSAPIRTKILEAVQANFKDRVDVVIVILDIDEEEPPGDLPYGVNYRVQSSSVHNPATPRFARLGNVWLTTRRALVKGPALHELLHGFLSCMSEDSTVNFIIPTATASHWGFSSAGGQLGGWDKNTLVSLGDGIYQATRPPYPPGYWGSPRNFGLNANGGNSLPYSNLELWTMGLIPDSELVSVDVAFNASFIESEPGKFQAESIKTYSPSEIIARISPDSRPSLNTPRAFRGLVVLATTRTTNDEATITQLNSDIEQFSMRSPIHGTYNFWTATGMRASLQLAMASELAR